MQTAVPLAVAAIHVSTEVYLGTIAKHEKGHHPEPRLLLRYEGMLGIENV